MLEVDSGEGAFGLNRCVQADEAARLPVRTDASTAG
jgi:hypothetical protein